MIFLTDNITAKSLPFETQTKTGQDEEVNFILTEHNFSMLESLKQYRKVAVSYYNERYKSFDTLDPEFLNSVASPLYNFFEYAKTSGIELLNSDLNSFSLPALFNESGKLKAYPKKVFVELTRNCNSLCKMCLRRLENPDYQSYNEKYNMEFGLFRQIADTLFAHADFVDLRGFGESLILPNFEKYLDYSLQYNTQFGLVTNMSLKNNQLLDKLLKHTFYLDISIDGADKATYESIRQGLSWEQLIKNVKFIASNARELSYVFFLFTVQAENFASIPQLIRLAAELGIKHVKLSEVSPPELFEKIYDQMPKPKFQDFLKKSKTLAQRLGVGLHFISKFGILNSNFKCRRPFESLFINYDGTIGGCNQHLSKLSLASFSKQNFFEQVNTPGFIALRNSIGKPYQNFLCAWCYKNRVE